MQNSSKYFSLCIFQFFEDTYSPTIEAAVRLQPRCSDKVERDSGIISFTTRLLVPTSRIGCLIGKGGAIITEMRRLTKANIRILSKDNLPKIASEDDEMVQVKALHFFWGNFWIIVLFFYVGFLLIKLVTQPLNFSFLF